jgi:hypothetical protein
MLLSAKSFDGMLQLNLCCSLFLNLLLHDLSSLHEHLSSGHVLQHKPKALVLLVKTCHLVLDDDFDFILSLDADLLEFWLLGVGLGCGAAATVMMKVGDMERRYWLRIPPLESMVAPPGLQASSRRQ